MTNVSDEWKMTMLLVSRAATPIILAICGALWVKLDTARENDINTAATLKTVAADISDMNADWREDRDSLLAILSEDREMFRAALRDVRDEFKFLRDRYNQLAIDFAKLESAQRFGGSGEHP